MITKQDIQDAILTHKIFEIAYKLLEERDISIELAISEHEVWCKDDTCDARNGILDEFEARLKEGS